MKIIHTSDWHLGRILYGRSLLEDQTCFFEEFFYPLLESERPDAVILAGDIFDRQIAPVEAIRLFDSFVSRVCLTYRIPLVAISGNHDGADRLGLGASLLRSSGFYLTARLDAEAPPVVLQDGGRPVHIYSLPYFDPAMARDYLSDDSLRGYQEAYRAVLERLTDRLDPGAFNILVAHCFVAGSEVSESESPLFIGGSGEIDKALFSAFDYTALGHLHRPQSAEAGVRYSGSPLKYSFDEERHKKSVTVLEIDGALSLREIPVRPLRELRTLTGTLEELREAAKADPNAGDYIFAALEGPPVFEPMARLREFYPNTLGVVNGSLSEGAAGGGRDALRNELHRGNQNAIMIFEEFLRQMCDTEPTEDDREIFCAARAEVIREDGR